MGIHIIDDEVFITELLHDLLQGYTAHIRCFHSAEAYLAYMNTADFTAPRLIITDIVMDRMSGFELAAHIRARLAQVRIIALSGSHAQHPESRYFDSMMAKPFDCNQLQSAVSRCYDSGQTQHRVPARSLRPA